MNEAPGERQSHVETRPTGFVKPTHEWAVSALKAIEANRIADAEKHIATIPESPLVDRAWKLLLRGLLAVRQADSAAAELPLLQACSVGLLAGLGREGTVERDALRLCALALHHTGRVYRRQDRPKDAFHAHLAAHHLRQQHGSLDELWETAIELGLDADVDRRYQEGQEWHRRAIDIAEKTSEEPACKQALAWSHLAVSYVDSGRHDEAVSAARTAREWWRQHDIGAATAAQADLKLGGVLLKQGEAMHERGDPSAKAVLDEAVEWLAAAHKALQAFGPDHAADTQLCLEQHDFARRLLASLET